MTEGGVSKKAVALVLIATMIKDIAVDDPNHKIYYSIILAVLLICYMGKQTFLDYLKDIKNKTSS